MGIASGVGKAILFILGLIFVLVGIFLTIIIITFWIGIPLIIVGLAMVSISLSGRGSGKIIVNQIVGNNNRPS